jgi:dTDP-4-amino-4,6-dideoxygalactose transaminase
MAAMTSAEPLEQVPVFRPLIRGEEIGAAVASLELGWLGMGSFVGQFEDRLKQFLQLEDRHVVAVSTGHAALHLALLLLGAGPGDEIITPAFNNVADFQAILATGAQPVFCDIDDSLCIDLDKAERLITPKTRALLVMDYGCLLCDHERVATLAERHGLRVVHDAAHSFGSKYRGRMVGSFSDIALFSFDPVKTLTCIDGGALVVRQPEEADALREMRLIGMSQAATVLYQNRRAWTYDVKRLGFRYHLANLHAAVGLAQLAHMPEITRSRQATGRYYNRQLGGLPGLAVPKTDFHDLTPFLYPVRTPAARRDALRAFLNEHGIDTGIHWQPGHWFRLLKDCRRGDLSVTDQVGHEIVSLPLHSCMPQVHAGRVVAAVQLFFAGSAPAVAALEGTPR